MSYSTQIKKSIGSSEKLRKKPLLSFLTRNKMLMRLFWGYVLTFTVVELGAKICHILDSIMVSNLQGARAMAAFGLTTPYTTAVEIISAIIVTGTQALYTRAAGKGDTEETNKIFSTALEVSVLISIVFTLILYLFNRQICIGLGASGENAVLYSDLMSYNLGFFGIVPFLIIYPFLCSMAALDGGKIYVTISAVILSVSDIGLNYLLSVPAGLGMLGIGLSSTISQVLAVVAIMPSFFRKTSMFRFSFVRISASVVNRMVKIGLPKMTRKLSTLIKKVMFNRLTLFAGGVHLMTANSVKSNIDNLFMCLTTGICGASLLLTQLFFSERDKDAVRNTAYISIASVIAGPGVLSVLLFVLAPIFVLPYGLGAEDAALTVTVLRYFSVSIVFISINELLFDYLQGVQRGKWAHVFIVFQRLTILPVAYVLIRLYGVKGLLLSYTLGEIPVTIGYVLAAWYLNRNKSEDSIHAFLCIPRSFDENKDHTLSFDIVDPEDVSQISESVQSFCSAQGIDPHRSMSAGLCTEELLMNIFTHGFHKDSRKHFCQVRVAICRDLVILRFRDDCPYFNPKEIYERIKNSPPSENMGTKIVFKEARDIHYSHVLNINTLMVYI